MAKIADLLDILARPERVTEIIVDELTAIKAQFGDERRSEIIAHAQDLSMEDLITPEDMVVTLSHTGYIKSQPLDDYRAQKRGGRGKQATAIKEEDFIDNLFVANTHDYILCFSNRGRVYWLKVYEVPQGSRICARQADRQPASRWKRAKRSTPSCRSRNSTKIISSSWPPSRASSRRRRCPTSRDPRKRGIIAINLDEGDFLIGVDITDGQHDVMLFSDGGKAVRFDEEDVRPMGRDARGVRRHAPAGRPDSSFPCWWPKTKSRPC